MNNKDKIMKKIKALLIGLVLSFSAPVFASDFDTVSTPAIADSKKSDENK